MEIQQSNPYALFLRSLGWTVIRRNGMYIFLKRIPFFGTLCKIQRTKTLPDKRLITSLVSEFHIRRLAIEPDSTITSTQLTSWITVLPQSLTINREPFLPTKTIRIDITKPEHAIFQQFSEAKRRAVRRAQKNGVRVVVTQDISSLIKVKNASAGFLGFITTHGIDRLWPQMAPAHAETVLAYTKTNKLVGGILMLYWNSIAYYWVAGTTKEGKHLFAPTLLVWEAIRAGIQKKAKQFDFVGVWDERRPDKNTEWKGFTKFKEGFGGTSLYYPIEETQKSAYSHDVQS